MGSTYTRQSSTEIVDGEVIQASDFNNEFEQIVSAFAASTGHSHDGTTAEGGNVTKLLGTAILLVMVLQVQILQLLLMGKQVMVF